MRRNIYIGLISLLTGSISQGQRSSVDSVALRWEKFTLKNGLQVILQPDLSQSEVSVEFWIHTGTRDEEQGKFGFAHFFEHATPYGLTKDTVLLNEFRSVRTNGNAQTRKDYTRYYVQVKASGLALALKYAADRFKADTSSITDTLIARHRKNVLNEMNRQETNPFFSPSASQAREAMTFGKDYPYGHGSYGSIKENEKFTKEEVREWYMLHFFSDNAILFMVGNFEPQVAKSIIEKEFSGLSASGKPGKESYAVAEASFGRITLSSELKSNFLSITWETPSWKSTENDRLQLLAKILDNRLAQDSTASILERGSSRLFNLYEWAGQFGVFASFSSVADSDNIERYLLERVNNIIARGVSEDELRSAELKVINDVKEMSNNLGFIGIRTELLGEGVLYANNPDYYVQRLRRQSRLRPIDIQNAAAKWLKRKGARMLLVAKN